MIGFMFLKEGETLPNDDFQTEDDREMRRVLEVGREDTKGKVEETGFKMKVDF